LIALTVRLVVIFRRKRLREKSGSALPQNI
jgi:hypothetical protein